MVTRVSQAQATLTGKMMAHLRLLAGVVDFCNGQ